MVLNNSIFGISKTRINTKPFPRTCGAESYGKVPAISVLPFPRVSGAKLQFVMQKKNSYPKNLMAVFFGVKNISKNRYFSLLIRHFNFSRLLS